MWQTTKTLYQGDSSSDRDSKSQLSVYEEKVHDIVWCEHEKDCFVIMYSFVISATVDGGAGRN